MGVILKITLSGRAYKFILKEGIVNVLAWFWYRNDYWRYFRGNCYSILFDYIMR